MWNEGGHKTCVLLSMVLIILLLVLAVFPNNGKALVTLLQFIQNGIRISVSIVEETRSKDVNKGEDRNRQKERCRL